MQNITIGRYPEDPQAQGVIKPEDGRWQLVLDREGYPHLYVQINTTDDEGKPVKGYAAERSRTAGPCKEEVDLTGVVAFDRGGV